MADREKSRALAGVIGFSLGVIFASIIVFVVKPQAETATWSGQPSVPQSTVANLPPCTAGNRGLNLATDTLLPALPVVTLGVLVGGGTSQILAVCTNLGWVGA